MVPMSQVLLRGKDMYAWVGTQIFILLIFRAFSDVSGTVIIQCLSK